MGVNRLLNFKWQPPSPSTYTPLLRRWFGNERALELARTRELYTEVKELYESSAYPEPDTLYEYIGHILEVAFPHWQDGPIIHLERVQRLVTDLFEADPIIFGMPDEPDDNLSLEEGVKLRSLLHRKKRMLSRPELVNSWGTHVVNVIDGIVSSIPASAINSLSEKSPFTISVFDLCTDHAAIIEGIAGALFESHIVEPDFFLDLRIQVASNYAATIGLTAAELNEKGRISVYPAKNKAPPHELLDIYLSGTPYHDFFKSTLPFTIPQKVRYEHHWLVAGSGHGKTQTLQRLIAHDLETVAKDEASIVVIDSQGDLIRKISSLKFFADNPDKLVHITPKDIEYPVSINIFDINRGRLDHYDKATKEQVVAGAIDTFNYLFEGLLGAELTAKQGVLFRFVVRLLLSFPETMGRNATIVDILDLMEDAAPFQKAIDALPDIPRRFFAKDFDQPGFKQTKEQIRYRLNAILENPTLERLFTATETKLDLFTELNAGRVVLIDTAKDFLKGSSPHYGRIFISLILQAVMERAALPENARMPTFLYVDEAAEYFDSNIDELLAQVRKYNTGCLFAHQYIQQASPQLIASLAANTSIKFVGGVSAQDARAFAPMLRTTPAFIEGQAKGHFAAHIRNVTGSALSLSVPFGFLEKLPRMDRQEETAIRALMRERYAIYYKGTKTESEPPPVAELDDDDDDDDFDDDEDVDTDPQPLP